MRAHDLLDEYITAKSRLTELEKAENELSVQRAMAKRVREYQELVVRKLWNALAKEVGIT